MKPVGFDNTMLSILLNPHGQIPTDPATGQPVTMAKRRAELLVEMLGKSRQKIIIPAPASAELMTAIGPDAQEYIKIISKSRLFELAPFDQRCAIELALMNREIFAIQDQKDGLEPYQKIKVDRLIIAVMKVAGVENVYTDDRGLAKRARLCGMIPVSTAELPIPTEDRQINMEFHVPTDEIPDPEPLPDTEIEDNGEG